MENEEIDLHALADAMNEAEEAETEQDEDQPETESEDSEADTETQEDEAEDDAEDDQPEGESLDDSAVVKWKTAAGEEFEAPISELKAGYMRNQDYTQKAQALSMERRQVQETLSQQFQQVEQYAKELGALQSQSAYIQQLETAVSQINRHDDPVGYNAAVNELLLARQQRDGLAAQLAQVQQRRTAEQQQQLIAAQQQAAQELASGPNALPGFGKELVQKLNETGRQYGLTEEELSSITDAKYIRILHDAMKYRELQENKPVAVSKAKAAKPSKQTRSAPPSTIDRTLKRFNAAPNIEDLARLMSASK